MNRRAIFPILIIIVAGSLFFSGCTSNQISVNPGDSGIVAEPIVGAWVLHPDPETTVLYLYVFKEDGRFDSAAFSGDPSVTLPFERYIIAGNWTDTGNMRYPISGQMINHDFASDSHQSVDVAETLVYDPATDSLFHEQHEEWKYVRISHDPGIPSGLDVSIPFD